MNHDLNPRMRRPRPALWAALSLAAAVTAGSAIAIANAQDAQLRAQPAKARACNSSNPCIKQTNNGAGPAIEAIGKDYGMVGSSPSGIGVEGLSTSDSGVFGDSSSYYGVLGESSGFYAALGGYNYYTSSGASGVYGQSEDGYGVTGYSVSSAGYAMYAEGNVLVSGEVYTAGGCHDGCSKTRHETSFLSRTSQPTIDDVGEGTLHNGIVRVSLAPDFANAIDTHKSYVVLLTPEGDAPLYVTDRTASGFDVRQIGGGHSSVQFAYRIVAKPFATTDERLPFKTATDFSTVVPRNRVR